MAAAEPWFIGERAEALATMYLTRRQDLDVLPLPARARGDDLWVRLRDADHPNAHFLVEVKGILLSHPRSRQPVREQFPVRYTRRDLGDRDVPVCLFLFTVDDEQGYYRWLYEPVITQGHARLRLDPRIDSLPPEERQRQQVVVLSKFKPLDDGAIDTVVQQVADWYATEPRHMLRRYAAT